LSVDGSLDFAPRYLSSKLSKLVAALAADVDASPAFVLAVAALAAASLALVVAVAALAALAVADVVADAASTIRSYFALFAFVVRG
jgi:hypothetical protein